MGFGAETESERGFGAPKIALKTGQVPRPRLLGVPFETAGAPCSGTPEMCSAEPTSGLQSLAMSLEKSLFLGQPQCINLMHDRVIIGLLEHS